MNNYAHIKKVWTANTGGNIMIDFIELINGNIIAISEDATGVYENMEAFEAGTYLSFVENF